eukprot:Hpha_TRINITY_DN15987_c2_g5::TRINITY_DN15987_c2_g5_i1::g.72308::m.72308/K00801/FDFT1; farnesyl-diphosphate farnesyltransferase
MQNRGNQAPASTGRCAVSPEVMHLVKAQRRVRGTVSAVRPGGRCELSSEHGTFSFDIRSVKPNKNHPDRKPQVGDPCEFRLSHMMPPTAVSVRVAVPKNRPPAAAGADSNAGTPLETNLNTDLAEKNPSASAAASMGLPPRVSLPEEPPLTMNDPELKRCRRMLDEMCGGIAPLANKLPSNVLPAVVVLMLQVRVLDSISKARSLPAAVRKLVLKEVHEHLEGDDSFVTDMHSCVESADRPLLSGFATVSSVFRRLSDTQRAAIRAAVQRRGAGMAEWQGREATTLDEYTSYCCAVGGEVARGIAAVCGTSLDRDLDGMQPAALGIFIEKTATVQGYLDVNRRPWPQEVWGKRFGSYDELACRTRRAEAVEVLNEMVADALRHAADALTYLSLTVDCPAIFLLSAVPFTLALTDLAEICGNRRAFSTDVGAEAEAVELIQRASHPREVSAWIGSALVSCRNSTGGGDEVGEQVERGLQALRRMDAAAASQAPMVGGSSSVTRQFLTQQGAPLGGRLLYSMLDSLHTVFEPSHPLPAESFAHDPYEPAEASRSSSPRGRGGLFSAVANTFWGLRRVFGGSSSEGRSDAFLSFYDGGVAPESGSETASQPGESGPTSVDGDLSEELEPQPMRRCRSVSPHRTGLRTVEMRSRTP